MDHIILKNVERFSHYLCNHQRCAARRRLFPSCSVHQNGSIPARYCTVLSPPVGPSEAGGEGASGGGEGRARRGDAGERRGGAEEERRRDRSAAANRGQHALLAGEEEKRRFEKMWGMQKGEKVRDQWGRGGGERRQIEICLYE